MDKELLLNKIKDPKWYLEHFTKIKTKSQGLQPFILNEAQKDIFNVFRRENRVIILKSRQLGFSTAAVGFLYHKTITTPAITSAIVGYNTDVCAELLDKIKTFIATTPLSVRPKIRYNSKYEISFPEMDSKILVLPSSDTVGRGYTLQNCLLTEVAFYDKAEEKMLAVENSVPNDGLIIVESCVTGDTLVLTNMGPRYVGEIHDWNNHNLGFSKGERIGLDGHYGVQQTDTYYNSGVRDGFRVKTLHGNGLGMSSVHKMFVLRGHRLEFVEAKNLKIGDYLAVKIGQELWGDDDIVDWVPTPYLGYNKKNIKLFSPEVVTKDLAYLVGSILGDGYVDFKHGRVTITTIDRDVSDFLLNNGLGLRFTKQRDGIHFNCKNDSFVEFLSGYLGMIPGRAPQKKIPSRVFCWSRENVAALLSGLFDADGCCVRGQGTVSFATTSEVLRDQIRVLLLNFGIISKTYRHVVKPTKKVKVSSVCFQMDINPRFSAIFCDKIGFRIRRKQRNLVRRKSLSNVLPGIGHIIKGGMNELGLKFSDVSRGLNKGFYSFYGGVREDTLRRILERCRNKDSTLYAELKELLEYGYFYDPIKSIEFIRDRVFDFTVENGHTVTYNGLVGHQTPNSMGNLFHRMWMAEDNGYVKKKYLWNWGYTEEEIELIKKRMNDPMRFAQEYGAEFLSSGRPVFPLDVVKEMYKEVLKVGDKVKDEDVGEYVVQEGLYELRMYKPPVPEHVYVVGADVSEGVTGGDYSVATIWDRKTGEEVAFWRGMVPPDKFGAYLNAWGRQYNNALMVVESNNNGLTTVTKLRDLLYPQMYFRQKKFDTSSLEFGSKLGWRTTQVTRPLLIDDFAEAMREHSILIHSKEILDEMMVFMYDDNGKATAPRSFHDDAVFSAGIGFQGFKVLYGGKLDQLDYADHLPISTPY